MHLVSYLSETVEILSVLYFMITSLRHIAYTSFIKVKTLSVKLRFIASVLRITKCFHNGAKLC